MRINKLYRISEKGAICNVVRNQDGREETSGDLQCLRQFDPLSIFSSMSKSIQRVQIRVCWWSSTNQDDASSRIFNHGSSSNCNWQIGTISPAVCSFIKNFNRWQIKTQRARSSCNNDAVQWCVLSNPWAAVAQPCNFEGGTCRQWLTPWIQNEGFIRSLTMC